MKKHGDTEARRKGIAKNKMKIATEPQRTQRFKRF